MEGRVESGNHRQRIPENLPSGANAAQRRWIMQRRQVAENLDLGEDLVIDPRGRREFGAAVNDAMADRMEAPGMGIRA